MTSSATDTRLLHRFLDGELAEAEAQALRTRLAAEPDLRAALQALQQQHQAFAAAARSGFAPSAGFTQGVLAAARRLPSRTALREAEAGEGLVRLCRRLLLAAVVLFGLGLLWHGGLFGGSNAPLQAAPDEVAREMERLDAIIQAGGPKVPGGQGAPAAGAPGRTK